MGIFMARLARMGFPSRFLIAKASRVPFFGKPIRALLARGLFPGVDLQYLPKSASISVGKTIEGGQQAVLPSDMVHRYIDKAKKRWIMNECICRAAEKCEHYPRDLGCLFLGEATESIDPRLGRMVSAEEAHAHVERAEKLGLVHMIGKDRLDSLWLGAKPEERLMTICNCCECCCLWKVIPDLPEDLAGHIKRLPGVSVEVGEGCVGCGACAKGLCFVDAISLSGGRAIISDACRGCGRCVSVCPVGAITLTIAKDTAETERRLDDLVDLE